MCLAINGNILLNAIFLNSDMRSYTPVYQPGCVTTVHKQGSAMMSHCVSLLTESSSPWPSASLALSTAETHKYWGQQWLCNSREDERITRYTVQLWTLKIKAQLFCNSQPQVTYHYWSNWESLLACQLLLFIMYQSIIRPPISAIVGQGGDLTN